MRLMAYNLLNQFHIVFIYIIWQLLTIINNAGIDILVQHLIISLQLIPKRVIAWLKNSYNFEGLLCWDNYVLGR